MWLKFLDFFFLYFHLVFTVFNLFGWIFKRTRKLNFITLSITGASWFILGIWYGIGYCPLTDWHWQVMQQLGRHDMPNSYIKFLIDEFTGLDVNAQMVDYGVFILFFAAFIISAWLNFKGRNKKKPVESTST